MSTNEPYLVLARKWRPAQFSDIVGQTATVRTLMNAVLSQRLHHAYLFTGARGIGKTSIARIFAKVIRCDNRAESISPEDHLPWLASCDTCSNCLEIKKSHSMDVLEIDGASHNGVEAIREIRENSKFLPLYGLKKIYIVDEVHMLTTAAFNALLKTLEEPPPHVIFIFATTEAHKLPATVVSRCQRFDFKRVSVPQIYERLVQITTSEKMSVELAALTLLARAADGSMRDALSLLDQVFVYSSNSVTLSSVRESIGVLEGQTYIEILRNTFERKPLEALTFVDQVFQRGYDLRQLARGLLEFLHAIILAKIGGGQSGLLEISEEEWHEVMTLTTLKPLEDLELYFQVFHQGLEWIAKSPQPKLILDVLLIKCASSETMISLAQLEQARPQLHTSNQPSFTAQPTQPMTSQSSTNTQSQYSDPQPHIIFPAQNANTGWELFIDHVRKSRPLLASILEHGHCTKLPTQNPGPSPNSGSPPDQSQNLIQNELVIHYSSQNSFFCEQLQSKVYHGQLLNLAREFFHSPVYLRVELILNPSEMKNDTSIANLREKQIQQQSESIRHSAYHHPIVLEAKSIFGGELKSFEWITNARP